LDQPDPLEPDPTVKINACLIGIRHPELCLEAYHMKRTRLELIAERKLRRRQLTDDGNVEITGRDLRERDHRPPARQIAFSRVAR
jgi:hypothetical protein